ncbi:hypothetical protein OHA04_27390 [Streptomyces sp. NBC_01590]|uniref:hypothetical protein n=1 Tax=Streptomyces sp. NBC_01590 TaxID=2975887 RepID=UPI00386CB4AF
MTDQPTTEHQAHPKEAEIRALLDEGLTNTAIRRRLYVGEKTIARIRAAAGIPPTPRSAHAVPRHPQERNIRRLLDEGYNNAAIRRRTGADVAAIAKMRKEGQFGKATIRTQKPYIHPRDAEIRARLRHHSSNAIADQLHVDRAAVRRIRDLAGIPFVPPKFATADEKWTTLLRPVDGGHVEWLGQRSGRSGTPVMRFREKSVSPAGIAFKQRTGRNPVGQVRAECEFRHCMAPDHIDDEPGRLRERGQLRAIKGNPAPSGTCPHGHDQAEHVKYEPDGTAYCGVCNREQRRARTRASTGSCPCESCARPCFDQPATCPDHGAGCEADDHLAPPTVAGEHL